MKRRKIFIIGYFGFETNQLDGQTIKTRNIYEALKKEYIIDYFDTEVLKFDRSQLVTLIKKIYQNNKVFFVGGKNNLKYFFPILFLLSIAQRKKIVYVVVGGWLNDFIQSHPSIYMHMLKHVKSILVETQFLKSKLQSLGFNNVDTIPNFRITPSYKISQHKFGGDTLHIVFMARIMNDKGIYLLFDLLNDYIKNPNDYKKKIKIDFFGPLDPRDKVKFKELVTSYSPHVTYKGLLDPSQIYYELPKYDVLILPTFYEGEGFPGTIVDAYLCGIPVITTKWKQIPEFVKEGETGFLIKYDLVDLKSKILLLIEDEQLLANMKNKAFAYSYSFSSDKGLKILKKAMGI